MKIAVLGAGISGLGSAYLLSQKHEVDLYEKENRLRWSCTYDHRGRRW